jgi:excisionase family DNA binding protein
MRAETATTGEGVEGLKLGHPRVREQSSQPSTSSPRLTHQPRGGHGVSDVERRTYTVPEVATILGIGRNTAYEICRTGEIPTIRIGGRVLVPRTAIDELLAGA